MKSFTVLLFACFCSCGLQAYSNFYDNPSVPYPPGCATLPDQQFQLYGDTAKKVAEQEIMLSKAYAPSIKIPVHLAVYRVSCADPGRSIIWLEFSSTEEGFFDYRVPDAGAFIGDEFHLLSLSRMTNTWNFGTGTFGARQVFGGSNEYGLDWYQTRWLFVLENWSRLNFLELEPLSPSQYNGAFTLKLDWYGDEGYQIEIPPTEQALAASPSIPLSGRLSGNWVVDGASDQGFLISISELVDSDTPFYKATYSHLGTPLLMFLSWYTFDAAGNKLWLTGTAGFMPGETGLTVPIEEVSNGEFMGSRTADRSLVGSVTLKANNCNDLTLDYNLEAIGLGSGTRQLERLYSLETAGYVCRDLEARMETRSRPD